jgi:drug/metabolite transporter (DMT)-like permease
MGAAEWLLLITLSILWGGSFFFNAVALRDLPPLTVVIARVAIAAAVLWLLIALSGQRLAVRPGLWLAFFAMGALNNVIPFTLIVWGQTRIGSGLASILNATTPLFTVILAHWLTRDEPMTPARVIGVVCGLLGVAVMIGTRAFEQFGLEVIAQLAVVGAAISYAFAGIFGRRFKQTPPLITAAGQLSASALMMLPVVMFVDRPWDLTTPGPQTWGAVFGLAVFSSALAYVIFNPGERSATGDQRSRRGAGSPASDGHDPDRPRSCRHRWTTHRCLPGRPWQTITGFSKSVPRAFNVQTRPLSSTAQRSVITKFPTCCLRKNAFCASAILSNGNVFASSGRISSRSM